MGCFFVCFHVQDRDEESYIKKRLLPVPNHYSTLPKVEKQVPLKNPRYFKTLCNYSPTDFRELHFKTGDVLEVEVNDTSNLYRAKHIHTTWIGLVSKLYLMKESLYELQPWFFNVDRIEASRLLAKDVNGPGSFLIRKSPSKQSPFTLTIRSKDHNFNPVIKHYKIFQGPNGYHVTEGITCDSLETLIILYLRDTNDFLGLCHRLVKPCVQDNRRTAPSDNYL